MTTLPAWLRCLILAAVTLSVWVVALMLFGASLGAGIGMFVPGGLRGVVVGALHGAGIACAIGFPFYAWGVGIAVHDRVARGEAAAEAPQEVGMAT